MLASGKAVVLPILLSAMLAGTAAAQGPTCSVDEGSPSQVAKAFLAVSQSANAQAAEKWGDAAKSLTSAVKELSTKPQGIRNTLGRDFLLGKALSLWLNQPGQSQVVSKASLGFVEGAAEQVDLVVATDSLFRIVESAQPACVATISEWRRQKSWVTMLNSAIEHVNANRLDSAEFVAKRSLILNKSPYGYMVLGNVAQNRQQSAEAFGYYRQTVEAATDSVYRDVREQTLVNMGNLASEMAEAAEGAEKVRLAKEAAAAYTQLVTEAPTSVVAPQARAGLSRAFLLQGDTAGFRNSLKEHLENPGKFSYQDVLASAVAAARANQWTEAASLFEGTLQSNPWSRDALFNVALSYHELKQFQKMLPFVTKLVQVDPSNGENWRLFAFAYNGLSKASKVAATQKAMNDSVVKYFDMAEKMPVQVTFTEFSNGAAKTTLSGLVANKATAEKSYTLRFEFLDKSGAVVATKDAPVGPVAAGSTGRFSVSVEGQPTVVAFRYAPLT